MSTVFRRIGRSALAITLAAVTFGTVATVGLSQPIEVPLVSASTEQRVARPAAASSAEFVVAYVLGQSGSDTGDVFAPYEVLATSPNFFVYTVAATPEPAPVGGGMSIVPTFTFGEVEAGTAPAPDLIVVPAVNSPAGASEKDARDFIVNQYKAGARVLGICAGSRLLAAAGILDGHRATSHWSRIAALEESNPEVTWVRGQRYVQDGRITTTGAVTSGIPGALKVITDLAGRDEGARVGELVRFPGWSPEAPLDIPTETFGLEDVPVLLNAMFPWARPTIGVELRNDVGEIDAGAIFEVYSYSQAAVANALSETGTITTKHGLVIRTSTLDDAGGAELVAGSLDSDSPGGFDAAFQQLSRSTSASVVDSVSKMLAYPLNQVSTDVAPLAAQLRPVLFLILSITLAVGVGMVPRIIRRMRHRSSIRTPRL